MATSNFDGSKLQFYLFVQGPSTIISASKISLFNKRKKIKIGLEFARSQRFCLTMSEPILLKIVLNRRIYCADFQ